MSSAKRWKNIRPFVKVELGLKKTPAWRDLSSNARSLYLELKALYNGKNNGSIALGSRGAGELMGMSRSTASRSFQELQDHGFIITAQQFTFDQKRRVTEWRLTELKCDRTGAGATHEYRSWEPRRSKEAVSATAAICKGGPELWSSRGETREKVEETQHADMGQLEETASQGPSLEMVEEVVDGGAAAPLDSSISSFPANSDAVAVNSPATCRDSDGETTEPCRSLDDPWWEEVSSVFDLRPSEYLEDWDVLLDREYAALSA